MFPVRSVTYVPGLYLTPPNHALQRAAEDRGDEMIGGPYSDTPVQPVAADRDR
jgi:hypothetical protein